MGDMLSQAEIDALLGGGSPPDEEPEASQPEVSQPESSAVPASQNNRDEVNIKDYNDVLTSEEKDILGEIGNISMGTAATTLFALLNKKVLITTPIVSVNVWEDVQGSYARPCVGTRIDYKEGLMGSNILILNQRDVKIITNLMMGGDGQVDEDAPFTDIDLSAIGEAMNQMIGSSSTSLSSLINLKIDIDTPQSFIMDFTEQDYFDTVSFERDEKIVCVSFRMEVDTLIDSRIMQILPIDFARDMVKKLKADMMGESDSSAPVSPPQPVASPEPPPQPQYVPPAPGQQESAPTAPPQQMYGGEQAPMYNTPQQYQQPMMDPNSYNMQQPMYPPPIQQYQQPIPMYPPQQPQQNINVQPVQFNNFDPISLMQEKENIGIIMDVPLEVSVELGRTHKKIKDILEFSPGTIIELDKLAGEPIDILINGKFVAKGEVVVVMDENFGVRITDIISVENRI